MAKPIPQTLFQRVKAIIKKIPRGKVATYGQIAALAGQPRAARQVALRRAVGSAPAQGAAPQTAQPPADGGVRNSARGRGRIEPAFAHTPAESAAQSALRRAR
ncbi:MGMT family protein [Cytophagia bacterium CHB2]|nr:MGMT family protein [Cytophagia bacterium CHB2]